MALGADHPSAASLGAAAHRSGRAADGGCARRERLAGRHGGAAPRPLGHERRNGSRYAARRRTGACNALAAAALVLRAASGAPVALVPAADRTPSREFAAVSLPS